MYDTEPSRTDLNIVAPRQVMNSKEDGNLSVIDAIIPKIKGVQNANLASQNRDIIAADLAEYQRALRQGVRSVHAAIARGDYNDKDGNSTLADTPESIIDYILKKSGNWQTVYLLPDYQNRVHPAAANEVNAALVQALDMLPAGVTVENLTGYLRALPVVRCTDQNDFDRKAVEAENKGQVVALTHASASQTVYYRGFSNPSLGATMGFGRDMQGVGLGFKPDKLNHIAKAALQKSI